jgi:hypothetical protein
MFKVHYYSKEDIEKFAEKQGCKFVQESGLFYMDIDFTKVAGFENLSERAKEVFINVYKRHNTTVGLRDNHCWIPESVKEHKTYVEVHFFNNQWLHYMPNGEWY